MTNTHVVSALRQKRAEISGHIHDFEKRIARQRANLAIWTPRSSGCF